jgi:hypothetical protein
MFPTCHAEPSVAPTVDVAWNQGAPGVTRAASILNCDCPEGQVRKFHSDQAKWRCRMLAEP